MLFKKRGESSRQYWRPQQQQPPPPTSPERQQYAAAIAAQVGNRDEKWDIYYHSFLLHTCLHSQCYWYRNTWWFPEPGRNIHTLSMFSASRYPPIEDIKYYDMHLKMVSRTIKGDDRYIGPDTPELGWLGDYVGYNLNLVTFDMKPI
ncbi:hypothetical protein V865_001394 [Kwoniella europaea PYCC6329]|uniref:Uncharacterized protein n=1 Tax=Kwoniella europaea PYCC6329 TaxID=1423913 RepID=A0AAX4KA47_9TREE